MTKIDKLDLYQKELHLWKEARLEGYDDTNDLGFIAPKMFRELTYKINEVIDAVNGKDPNTTESGVTVAHPPLFSFINEGESLLMMYPGARLRKGENYDVVCLPDMSAFPSYETTVEEALQGANKRVILGFFDDERKPGLECFLDTTGFTWFSDKNLKEHYIIEKTPETLA